MIRFLIRSCIAVFGLASLPSLHAQATTGTWVPTAAGTSYIWSSGANWNIGAGSGAFPGSVAGATQGVGDTANLTNNIAGAQTLSLNAAIVLGTLNIGDSDSSHLFTIANGTGGSLTFDVSSGSAQINKTGTLTDQINASIILNDALIVDVAAGRVNLDGAVTGNNTITKNNTGIMRLNSANTLSGVILNAGTLYTGNNASLGSTSTLTFNGGILASGSTRSYGAGLSLVIAGNVQFGDSAGASAQTFAGTVNLSGDARTLTMGQEAIFNGVVSNGSIVKAGSDYIQFGNAGNTFTDYQVNSVSETRIAASGDVLGTGTVTFNASGATLRSDGATARSINNNVVILNSTVFGAASTGDLTIGNASTDTVDFGGAGRTLTVNNTTTTFIGKVTNNAGGTLTKSGAGSLVFEGQNDQTGNIQINTGNITVQGALGRLSSGTGFTIVGDNNGNDESLTLGNSADMISGTLDHVGDNDGIQLNGQVSVVYNGPAAGSAGVIETMGALQFIGGAGSFSLNPAAGGDLQVNVASLTNANNGTGILRGTGLGLAAGTPGSTRVIATAAPSTVGLGGTGSSASIIAFLIGGSSATAAPDTFLRYDTTNGVTALAAGDYAAAITGSINLNVSVAGGETVSADAFINALRVTGGTTTVTAGSAVTVGSGAILFTGNATLGGAGRISFDDRAGGTRQGVIHASADTTSITGTISASLEGSSGLVVGDAGDVGNVVLLSGDNRIIGGVTINGGTLRLGSAGALNNETLNDLTLRAGNGAVGGALSTALQLGGNSVAVLFGGNDRLQGSTRIENASATAATLTIVVNATSDDNDGILQDGTGGGALSLVKRGTARLELEQTNTFTGTTEVLQGILQLNTSNGRLTNGTIGSSDITLRSGATLNLNNANNANQTDRILNTAALNMHGATFQHDSNQGTVNYSESLGALNVLNGSNTINTDFAASGQTMTLTFASLNGVAGRPDAGAAINFQNFATTGDLAIGEGVNRHRVEFTAAPALSAGGIIAGGSAYHTKDFATTTTQDVVNFASYGDVDATAATANSIFAFASYNTGLESTWGTTTVANPAADVTLGTSRTIEAIRLGGGIDIAQAGFTLNLSQGGLIHNGTDSTISGGTLTAGGAAAGELAIRTEDNLTTSTLTISSIIADNGGGAVSLLKTGADNLTLSGANTYTGRTTLQGGTVSITADANLGAAPAAATAGHLRLYGVTLAQTATTGTVTLNANRGLELGGGANTISTATGSTLVYNAAGITSNGDSGLTLTGDVDMAVSAASTIGGSFSVAGPGTGTSAISFSGAANVIGGSLLLGQNGTSTLTYGTAGGSLSVGGNNPNTSNLDIGLRSTANTNGVGVLNLAGSNMFTATVNLVRLGVMTSSVGSGTLEGDLILSTNASITALTSIVQGDHLGAGPGGGQSGIQFGAGTSSVVTPTWVVGGGKGSGLVNIASGGTLNVGGFGENTTDLFLARNTISTAFDGVGIFDMTGGTLIADLDQLVIADKSSGGAGGATGTFTLAATANDVSANSLVLGRMAGAAGPDSDTVSAGTLTMAGGAVLIRGDITLASHDGTNVGTARGTLNLNGGTFTTGGNIAKAGTTRASAIINVNGGTLDMQDQANGDTTQGTFTGSQLIFRSGSIVDTASVTLDAVSVTSGTAVGTFTEALILRDVTLAANVILTSTTANTGGIRYEAAGGGASGGTISGTVDLGAANRTINVEQNASAQTDLAVTGVISNSSGTTGVTKTGNGLLTFTAANTYNGDTTVSAGALLVNNTTGSGTGTGNVTVASGAEIGGTGSISGSVIINGNLTPGGTAAETTGYGIGVLETGSVVFGATSTNNRFQASGNGFTGSALNPDGTVNVAFISNTANRSASADRLEVTGNLDLGSNNGVNITFLPLSYSPAYGDAFDLLDWTGVITLTNFNFGTIGVQRTGGEAAGAFDLDLQTLGAGLAWNIDYFATHGVIVVVPEPGRVLLLFVGIASIAFRRRRAAGR